MVWTTPRTWISGDYVTAGGLNTDIRDNLNHIKNRVQTGTVAITPVSGVPTSVTVTFERAFNTTPRVLVTALTTSVGSGANEVSGVGAHTESASSFVATITRNNTSVTNVRWLAMEIAS